MSYFPCRKCGKMIGVVGQTVYTCDCTLEPAPEGQTPQVADRCPSCGMLTKTLRGCVSNRRGHFGIIHPPNQCDCIACSDPWHGQKTERATAQGTLINAAPKGSRMEAQNNVVGDRPNYGSVDFKQTSEYVALQQRASGLEAALKKARHNIGGDIFEVERNQLILHQSSELGYLTRIEELERENEQLRTALAKIREHVATRTRVDEGFILDVSGEALRHPDGTEKP